MKDKINIPGTMRVKVVKSEEDDYWYAPFIGEIFEIEKPIEDNPRQYDVCGRVGRLDYATGLVPSDCEEVEDKGEKFTASVDDINWKRIEGAQKDLRKVIESKFIDKSVRDSLTYIDYVVSYFERRAEDSRITVPSKTGSGYLIERKMLSGKWKKILFIDGEETAMNLHYAIRQYADLCNNNDEMDFRLLFKKDNKTTIVMGENK